MSVATAADDFLAPDPDTITRFLRETVGNDIHLAWIVPDGGRGACGGRWFGEDVDTAVIPADEEFTIAEGMMTCLG